MRALLRDLQQRVTYSKNRIELWSGLSVYKKAPGKGPKQPEAGIGGQGGGVTEMNGKRVAEGIYDFGGLWFYYIGKGKNLSD